MIDLRKNSSSVDFDPQIDRAIDMIHAMRDAHAWWAGATRDRLEALVVAAIKCGMDCRCQIVDWVEDAFCAFWAERVDALIDAGLADSSSGLWTEDDGGALRLHSRNIALRKHESNIANRNG